MSLIWSHSYSHPVHSACTASLRQRWHSNIGVMATFPKLSYVFCQELLPSLPSAPSSSQATLLSPVPRWAGAEDLWGHSSKPGGSWGGGHSRDTQDFGAALANTSAPAAGQWPNAAFVGPATLRSRWPGSMLTMQVQTQQSCALQISYRPFRKAALNLHRVTSCTGL